MKFHLKIFKQVDTYQLAALPFLRAHAAHLNQLLMACERLTQAAVEQQGVWLACLYENDDVIAVANAQLNSILPLSDLTVSDWPPQALPLLVEALTSLVIASVNGPLATAQSCGVLLGLTEMQTQMWNYVLSDAPVPQQAHGNARCLARPDMALLADWIAAFDIECNLPLRPRPVLMQAFESELQTGGFRRHYLWCVDGVPVAMAGRSVAGALSRIGPVYTLPTARGRGYAGALVAYVASQAISSGVKSVCLYADAANPTSNALYQRIGFLHTSTFAKFKRDASNPVPPH